MTQNLGLVGSMPTLDMLVDVAKQANAPALKTEHWWFESTRRHLFPADRERQRTGPLLRMSEFEPLAGNSGVAQIGEQAPHKGTGVGASPTAGITAPSFNGRTLDFGSGYGGSNPSGAIPFSCSSVDLGLVRTAGHTPSVSTSTL